MKKLALMLMLLQMVFASVCQAFEPPSPDRWISLGNGPDGGVWFDSKSYQTFKGEGYKYIDHEKHDIVKIWILVYKKSEETSHRLQYSACLQCKQVSVDSAYVYDKDEKCIASPSIDIPLFKSVAPDTFGEFMLDLSQYLYDNGGKFVEPNEK